MVGLGATQGKMAKRLGCATRGPSITCAHSFPRGRAGAMFLGAVILYAATGWFDPRPLRHTYLWGYRAINTMEEPNGQEWEIEQEGTPEQKDKEIDESREKRRRNASRRKSVRGYLSK